MAFIIILSSAFCSKNDISQVVPAPPNADSTFSIIYPFWSHNGSKILFFGHVFGLEGYDLYEVDASGGIARSVMRDSLAKGHPVLSPDGTKIAYLAAQPGRLDCCAHVWVLNVNGTRSRDLTPFFSNWEYVRWSPDSRYLTFDGGIEHSSVVNYQIVKADVETGELTVLTRGDYGNRDATFLSDGRRIVYLSGRIQTDYGGKVWVMNQNGSDPRPIDTTRTASTYPRPSPVSNELHFYWGLGLEGDAGVYAVNLDTVSLPAQHLSFRFINSDNYLNLAQWSPDGNWFLTRSAYTTTTNDLVLYGRNGVVARRITTGFVVFLHSYAWSRDSRYLVFNATNDNWQTTSFFTFDLETGFLSKLVIKRK